MEKKPIDMTSLILMIVGGVFALCLPIVTYPCCIISLVLSVQKRETHNTTFIIIIDIILLVLALINSFLGILLSIGMISSSY